MRGINVGGANKLSMKALVEIFEEMGCSQVRTYIQSGNVVFRADDSIALGLDDRVAARIADRFQLRVPIVLRTVEELAAAVDNNPFVAEGVEEKALHLAFLAGIPSSDAIASLDPHRSPPDRFEVRGRDLYLHLPNGVARTKLTNAYIDSKLGTLSTLRNWRTVLTLLGMTRGA
jgi:uncharacterized protein (DUF1697 family)